MNVVPVVISRKVFRSILILKKNSPNLMFAGGIVGVVGSTILACRATLKLADELPKMKHELNLASENSSELTDEDHKRSVAMAYGNNTMKVVKLYGPSVVVGVISIGALTGSHVAITRRNAGLTAAYAAVSKAYDEYRNRVKEEVGDDRERDIYHSVKVEKIDTEEGYQTKIEVVNPNEQSPYAKSFDEYSRDFQKSNELNRLFITCQQNYANNILHARGHLFLNEVYDMLGFEHTSAGAVVGWVVGDLGDNYVDFGAHETESNQFNPEERIFLLDFNVDGVIYDKI